MQSNITDKTLHPSGELKIEWARRNMPLLHSIEQDFIKTQPFAGLTIVLSIHLEAKTARLCRALQAGGANMVVTGSNPLSTQDDIAAALAHGGMTVFARHGCTMEEHESLLCRALETEPDIIIDDGGDLVNLLHTRYPHLIPKIIGGCEETTTGILRLQAMERAQTLRFPMIAVNDADCKHLFDNRYGTGQSVFTGINRITNLIVAGKQVVVAGYGWCGKGVAMRAKGLGAKVIVTEIDPVKAIEAVMDGFAVLPMDAAAALGDVFITVTGNCDVVGETAFARMKDGAVLCNAGHFDIEVNVARLRELAVETKTMRDNIEGFRLSDGRWLYVLAQGRLVNLACGDGHPVEIMDMSFAIQALSAQYLAESAGALKPALLPVPTAIDQTVARLKLASLGITIDTLTPEQETYLGKI
ncbi:MAG: adenosylhomocysteinase [Clostridiales bacterium]|nr:adenosylhomocysteinase [Clostridiales bacterium]